MTGRTLLAALVALAVGAAVLLLWPRHQPTPEEEIRALVAACVAAAEKKDVSTLSAALAPEFRSSGGSRDEVKGLLLGVLMRNAADVVVLNPSLEVTVAAPEQGTFRGTFVFARAGTATELSRYQIDGTVQKRDGAWRFTAATWRQP